MLKETTVTKNGSIKDFTKNNLITIIFAVLVLFGLIMTKDTPLVIMGQMINGMIRNSIIVLALLIPIMAGMGFNFSIGIGAMAGQLAIIMSINWGLTGFFGFLATVVMAGLFALLFGFLVGILLNKARGHEMITSLFIGYIGNSIYQYILLFLVGAVIPFAAKELVLSSGMGLKNTIDLNGTLYQSLDGLIEVSFFMLLLVVGLVLLGLNIYRLKKEHLKHNKAKLTIGIVLSSIVTLISMLVLFVSFMPRDIIALQNLKFPLITGLVICALLVLYLILPRTKFGQDIQLIASDQTEIVSKEHNKKLRIRVIIVSTVLAALGQIISLQNIGVMNTYGSHRSIGLFGLAALIIGGASLKKATVWHALIGLLLYQGFTIISIPVFYDIISGNTVEVIRSIILNGVYVYAFTMTLKKSHKSNNLLET